MCLGVIFERWNGRPRAGDEGSLLQPGLTKEPLGCQGAGLVRPQANLAQRLSVCVATNCGPAFQAGLAGLDRPLVKISAFPKCKMIVRCLSTLILFNIFIVSLLIVRHTYDSNNKSKSFMSSIRHSISFSFLRGCHLHKQLVVWTFI